VHDGQRLFGYGQARKSAELIKKAPGDWLSGRDQELERPKVDSAPNNPGFVHMQKRNPDNRKCRSSE
jgi:hypothetical protein